MNNIKFNEIIKAVFGDGYQAKFARHFGYTPRHVWNICHGRNRVNKLLLPWLIKNAKKLKISIDA